jgi:multisubunit Na+/H+ antiporter MnhE subunit
MKVTATMAINPDATATGTLAVELQKSAATTLGITSLADFSSALTKETLSSSGLTQFDACTPTETSEVYVETCTFTNATFTTPGTAPWTITKDGATITLHVVNAQSTPTASASASPGASSSASATASAGSGTFGDASFGTVDFTVTFPGTITSVAGAGAKQTSDTTVQITGSLTDSMDVTVTSNASSGGGKVSVAIMLLVLVAILLLIIVVAVVLIVRRRRTRANDVTP